MWSRLGDWWRDNTSEIDNDIGLRYFGAALALVHGLTYIFWRHRFGFLSQAAEGAYDSVCWPFFPACEALHVIQEEYLILFLQMYGLLALATAGCFLLRRVNIHLALGALFALNIFKLYFYYGEARLFGNYHAMPFLLTFVYFVFPNKWNSIRTLLVCFYVGAGVLKLNPEWLSGATSAEFFYKFAYTNWLVRATEFFKLANAAVVMLELWLVFLLLSSRKSRILIALIPLLLFHLVSWAATGFFYPTIMFALLSAFPLFIYVSKKISYSYPRNIAFNLFLALYIGFQALPWTLPGDAALTGEGRWGALSMYDAYARCYASAVATFANERIELPVDKEDFRGVRVWCDPYFYRSRLLRHCEDFKRTREDFRGISLRLYSKRTMDTDFVERVSFADICAANPSYQPLSRNEWIQI